MINQKTGFSLSREFCWYVTLWRDLKGCKFELLSLGVSFGLGAIRIDCVGQTGPFRGPQGAGSPHLPQGLFCAWGTLGKLYYYAVIITNGQSLMVRPHKIYYILIICYIITSVKTTQYILYINYMIYINLKRNVTLRV